MRTPAGASSRLATGEETTMDRGMLSGDAALVTGAASGIGRGIAIALAREGARVVLSDIDSTRVGEAVTALRAQGHDARMIATDLAAPEAPGLLLRQAIDAL